VTRRAAFIGCSHTSSIILARLGEEVMRGIDFRALTFRELDLGFPYGPLVIYNPANCGRVNKQEDKYIGSTTIQAMLETLRRAEPEILFTAVNGNEHSMFSIINRGCDLVEGDSGMQPVTDRQIARALARMVKTTILVHEVLRASAPDAEIVSLLPPPPLKEVARTVPERELFGDLALKHGTAPGPYRLRVHHLACEVVRQDLEALGVRSLTAPPESRDPEGYLLPALQFGWAHGNESYGRLVLNQIGPLL
jgi:hypothetical protein